MSTTLITKLEDDIDKLTIEIAAARADGDQAVVNELIDEYDRVVDMLHITLGEHHG